MHHLTNTWSTEFIVTEAHGVGNLTTNKKRTTSVCSRTIKVTNRNLQMGVIWRMDQRAGDNHDQRAHDTLDGSFKVNRCIQLPRKPFEIFDGVQCDQPKDP